MPPRLERGRQRSATTSCTRLACEAPADVPLFDPDQPSLLRGGDMPSLIAAACAASGQAAPAGPGELIRSILVSLACKYRLVLERLQKAAGRRIAVLHVVGGGIRNALLCQLTADLLGLPVLAGPEEATALGNVLVQARACGELGSLVQMRELVAASIEVTRTSRREDSRRSRRTNAFESVTGLLAQASGAGRGVVRQGDDVTELNANTNR